MNYLHIKGSAREIGRQIGEHAAVAIGETYDSMEKIIISRISRTGVTKILPHLSRDLEEASHDIHEEIRGLAEGSGQTYGRVMTCNYYNYLCYLQRSGCTNIMFPTSEHGPVLGKNGDSNEPPGKERETWSETVMRRDYDSGLSTLTVGLPGLCEGQGITSRGLALGGSSVWPRDMDRPGQGLSDTLFSWNLICAGSFAEVRKRAAATGFVGKGENLAVLSADGKGAVFECSPTRNVARLMRGRPLFCANFYASGKIPMKNMPEYLANAKGRHRLLKRVLGESDAELTLAGMKGLLAGHRTVDEKERAVCQHGS